jgi:prepilin-type N-terminal cleavage/methylation domain-containing protein
MKQNGFTLIELLVVIAVIALLASVVLVALNNSRAKARVARAASDLSQISKLFSLYLAGNNGVYPCFDHNWDDAKEIAWASPYAKWPKNPWGGVYHWEHQGSYIGQPAIKFSISINNVPVDEAQALAQLLNSSIDGSSGTLQYVSSSGDPNNTSSIRVEYAGIDPSIPLVDCHI